jgi:DNA-binding CsgD family transcriptional regulator
MANQIYFQWQNPTLRETIYPFRNQKLRDFLLAYREIDLMKSVGQKPVDPTLAQQIIAERTRLQILIQSAQNDKKSTEDKIKTLQQEYRALLSNSDVRKIQFSVINQKVKVASLEASMKSLKRRRDWYEQNAPEHPYFAKWDLEYQAAVPSFQAAQKELQSLQNQLLAKTGPYENKVKALQEFVENRKQLAQDSKTQLAELPAPDAQGKLTSKAAVRWLMVKYRSDLEKLEHDDLLKAVVKRFQDEPNRYPAWLQYMVIHFSGMRYKSAHGSWADPLDLVESLSLEKLKMQLDSASPAQIDNFCQQAIAALTLQKGKLSDPKQIRLLDLQIQKLQNPFQRQRALLAFQGDQKIVEVDQLTEQQALDRLKGMKSDLPDWAWKEIVARTDLKLVTTDENWEKLTPDQQQERWSYEDQHWRAVMDAWEMKDITAWRNEHEHTLQLIVSRAVCNEIAEHIQHLRGLEPGGGLTAKPNWYLRGQAAYPGEAYFRRPMASDDLKSGASIMFLGWVDRQPNAWQIALPLPGIQLAPGGPPGDDQGNQKDEKKNRPARHRRRGRGGAATGPGMWLRWTHEATVVEVAEMSDGWTVLTFETGQIGLCRRPLWRLVNNWDIFVGYMPPGKVDSQKLADMLDLKRILPAEAPPEGIPAPFEVAVPETPARDLATLIAGWDQLTPRQKQVIANFCSGLSVREIATRLDTSTSTIYTHIWNAQNRLGIHNRSEICAFLEGLDLSPWLVKSLAKKLNRRK